MLILYHNATYSYASCVQSLEYQNAMQSFAHQEALVAGIPLLKERILLDRPDWYGLTTDKVKFIAQYKAAHNKPSLTDDQIYKINEIENNKKQFLQKSRACQ